MESVGVPNSWIHLIKNLLDDEISNEQSTSRIVRWPNEWIRNVHWQEGKDERSAFERMMKEAAPEIHHSFNSIDIIIITSATMNKKWNRNRLNWMFMNEWDTSGFWFDSDLAGTLLLWIFTSIHDLR